MWPCRRRVASVAAWTAVVVAQLDEVGRYRAERRQVSQRALGASAIDVPEHHLGP